MGAQRLVVRIYLQRLKSWHQRVTDRPWLYAPSHPLTVVTSTVLICLALFASAHMRVWQYAQWSDAQDLYYVEDFPAFSTTDAAYFLLVAQQIKTHGSSKNLIRKRSYPDFVDYVPMAPHSVLDEPLLAVLISHLSPDASLRSLSMTAHQMLPILVALTALAVVLAFGAAGFGAKAPSPRLAARCPAPFSGEPPQDGWIPTSSISGFSI